MPGHFRRLEHRQDSDLSVGVTPPLANFGHARIIDRTGAAQQEGFTVRQEDDPVAIGEVNDVAIAAPIRLDLFQIDLYGRHALDVSVHANGAREIEPALQTRRTERVINPEPTSDSGAEIRPEREILALERTLQPPVGGGLRHTFLIHHIDVGSAGEVGPTLQHPIDGTGPLCAGRGDEFRNFAVVGDQARQPPELTQLTFQPADGGLQAAVRFGLHPGKRTVDGAVPDESTDCACQK